MPDLTVPGVRVTPVPKGMVARANEAVRYMITGVAPANWFGPLQPLKPIAPEGTGGRAFEFGGGWLLAHGFIENNQMSGWVGSVCFLGGIAWSAFEKIERTK